MCCGTIVEKELTAWMGSHLIGINMDELKNRLTDNMFVLETTPKKSKAFKKPVQSCMI